MYEISVLLFQEFKSFNFDQEVIIFTYEFFKNVCYLKILISD